MAAKLILKFKENIISEFPILEEETTIGRKDSNDIHIDNLAVSGHHARILCIGKKVILEDLKSTNGTFVNGAKIIKHILNNSDEITLGKHTLVYVEVPDEEIASAKAKHEMEASNAALQEKNPQEDHESSAGEKTGAVAEMPLAGIQVIAGPMQGRIFELGASLTSIGKADSCKIQVKGLLIGQQAAVITRRPNGYHITHMDGMTKPKVNGEPVGQEPRYLSGSDIIEIGDTKLEFFFK